MDLSEQTTPPVPGTSSRDPQHTRRSFCPEEITESDRFKCRLWMICDKVVCYLMRQIFTWVISDWDGTLPFKQFLKNKMSEAQFKQFQKNLHKQQMELLEEDPYGNGWDTTLIYMLLRNCGVLAGMHDTAWSSKSTSKLESSLSLLKDFRNSIAHGTHEFDKTKFFEKTEEIRALVRDALVSVGKRFSRIHQTDIAWSVKKFNDKINKIRDASFSSENLLAYKNELIFSELVALMNDKGVEELKKYLKKRTSLNPLTFIVEKSGMEVKVTDIYTGMLLQEENGSMEVHLEDLFDIAYANNPGEFLLLKGHAGIGKTTIVKKITSDWHDKLGSIKRLDSYVLLLYAELRDRIGSLEELLKKSLGEVQESFRGRDIVDVALRQKCLVILDGYDEINPTSQTLFQDVMTQIKFPNNWTVLVTTRPEAEKKLTNVLKSANVKAVHIWLTGINANKRAEFVGKYFSILTRDYPPKQGLHKLFLYLEKTENTMSEVWKLPYNLAMLTILWVFKPHVVNTITTEAELYWEMNKCIISKLEERLQRSELTGHLPPSVVSLKREIFLQNISWLSLIGLRDVDINISESAYNEIADLCSQLRVPVEELAGAFLKKVTTCSENRYSFPHKGNQEFMGAYGIYKKVTGEWYDKQKVQKWTEELLRTSIPPDILAEIFKLLKVKQETTITEIFEKLHGGSLRQFPEKYQNLLIQTLSISQAGDLKMSDDTKREALDLLEESGLKDKDSWLKVLHNLKCDNYTAKWIVERKQLFSEFTEINDFSFEAYIALLRAIKSPIRNQENIKIKMKLKHTHSRVGEIARQIARHNFSIERLSLRGWFTQKRKRNLLVEEEDEEEEDEESAIKLLLHSECFYYEGVWSRDFHLPPAMKYLIVRLPDQTAMEALWTSLEATSSSSTRVEILFLWLSANFSYTNLRPIPDWIPDVRVFIADVESAEAAEAAGNILRGLQQPDVNKRAFFSLYFPRCSMEGEEEIMKLLESLWEVRVVHWIYLPEQIKPSDVASLQRLRDKAKDTLGCFGDRSIQWIEDKDFSADII